VRRLLGVFALALAACSSSGGSASASASARPEAATSATGVTTLATGALPARPAALERGAPAPDVVFAFADGTTASLASMKGQPVLVYFYPQDDTPGCTAEAEGIRDAWSDFQAANIKVIGVSMQDATSHQAFTEKLKIPFPLAIDADGALATAFHVPVRDHRTARQSFLIDKDGKIAFVWTRVDPAPHAADVLKQLKGS
jgi:peroxiredoxin Q/BCP